MANDRFNLDDYIPVSQRLQDFRKEYAGWALLTDVIVDDGKRFVVVATVYDPDGVAKARGHAEEIRDQGPVNKTSALENAETSAWGRALANLGLHVSHQIASRDEIQQARERATRQREPATVSPAAELAGIIRDQHPPAVSDAFKAWLEHQGYPNVPKSWTEDHLAAIREWVAQVDLTGEIPAPPGSVPQSLIPATEGVGAPDGAGNASRGSGGVMDARVAAAAEYVKGLDSAQLLSEFAFRNLRAPRPVGEQRIALAATLVDDDAWQPEAVV